MMSAFVVWEESRTFVSKVAVDPCRDGKLRWVYIKIGPPKDHLEEGT